MKIECKSAEAFEDQLTTGKLYSAIHARGGSYYIRNDNGQCRWYGASRFGHCIGIEYGCKTVQQLAYESA